MLCGETTNIKITDAAITIVDGQLTIEGQSIKGLFEHAQNEPQVRKQAEISISLPPEDLTPGHVFPGVVFTTLRSS